MLDLNVEALALLNDFSHYYEPIVAYHFDQIKSRKQLGEKTGPCRFCNKEIPEVSFKNVAHALPQFIGNRYLITSYECDSCNKFFSETCENEMANFMKLFHATYQVRGEKKIPVFKSKELRLQSDSKHVDISDIDDSLISISPELKKLSINVNSEKYIPISVYKCLIKMALSIFPESEIPNVQETIKWLTETNVNPFPSNMKNALLIYTHTSGYSFPYISAVVAKRKSNSPGPSPTFIFRLCYSNFSFQVFVPFCKQDASQNFTLASLKYFPHLIDVQQGVSSSEKVCMNLSSSEKSELPITVEAYSTADEGLTDHDIDD